MSMSHLYGTDGEDGVEMESFEVSDWDLQNEFNPHRHRHRQTKEEATYGVWAERDSDEERPSFGGKRCERRGGAGPSGNGAGMGRGLVPQRQSPASSACWGYGRSQGGGTDISCRKSSDVFTSVPPGGL